MALRATAPENDVAVLLVNVGPIEPTHNRPKDVS